MTDIRLVELSEWRGTSDSIAPVRSSHANLPRGFLQTQMLAP